MKTKRIIELKPVPAGSEPLKYYVTEGGITMGGIWSHGAVTDNAGALVSRITVQGIARLLGMDESSAREFFLRELDRLNPDWSPLP